MHPVARHESDDPLARPLVTTYLTETEYRLLLPLPAHPLVKRRYPVRLPEGELGIDLFEGTLAGLETAEIELPDASALAVFAPPVWLVRDVSTDPRYFGGALAQAGAPPAS